MGKFSTMKTVTSYHGNTSDGNSNITPLINTIDTKESMRYKQPTKQTSVLQAKQLFRVSHFNPAGIALTSFSSRSRNFLADITMPPLDIACYEVALSDGDR